jgi:iron(III) transport system permease protein
MTASTGLREPAPPDEVPGPRPGRRRRRPLTPKGFVLGAALLVLAAYLVYPMVLLVILTFNTAPDILVGAPAWGFSNWVNAWKTPGLLLSVAHSFEIWGLTTVVSLPLAIGIALLLARTNIPGGRTLEFLFWVAFIVPTVASTLGWVMLLQPTYGFVNRLTEHLPLLHRSLFNVYSVPGIVFVKIVGEALAFKVILLTAAFRNMDGAMEEASRVSGASNLKTMLRVTLPVMISPIALAVSLQLIQMFRGFETEFILGSQFNYYVFSTEIYNLIRLAAIPDYANAVVLGTVTLAIIAIIIPLQRWVVGRRHYTTVDSAFRPGVIKLGKWRWIAFAGVLLVILIQTVAPTFVLLVGSFMTRVGFFDAEPTWTTLHWVNVFSSDAFQQALGTTIKLALAAGVLGPILFSLIAYVIVRTRIRGRNLIDALIWLSAAMPGTLIGLGLLLVFLGTPGLKALFGTIWLLLIVVVLAGITTGTNVFKGVLVQLGAGLEEAGRASGAGWLRTYVRVVIPLLMPSMVLVGMMNFVTAAGTTSSVILLASDNTQTLSLLALQYGAARGGQLEEAGIISIITLVITVVVALPFRMIARRLGVRHDVAAGVETAAPEAAGAPGAERSLVGVG